MQKTFFRLALMSLLVSLAVAWVMAVDSDEDGMSDAYELFFGLDPAVNDASSNNDSDLLSNLAESLIWTDPFVQDTDRDSWPDDVDSNAVSRALVPWGHPKFTSSNNTVTYTWPSWMVSAWAVDGTWQTNPAFAWHSSYADGSNAGWLNMDVDRSLVSSNLVLQLAFFDHTNSSMFIDLYDTNEVITATNLYGNLNTGAATNLSRTIEIPFADYPSAVGIHLRKGEGAMTIYSSLLYLDADLDGLDAEQEAQLGTSDQNADSDNDGISDFDEVFTYGTNPLSSDTDGDGLSDFAEIETYHTDPLVSDSDYDGISDALEVAMGREPTVSNSYTRLPFTEFFETNTVSIGDLAGQNNWEASHTNVALVQTNTVYEGAQALYMSYSGDEPVDIGHIFADDNSIVWIDFWTHAVPSAIPTNGLTKQGVSTFGVLRPLAICDSGGDFSSHIYIDARHDCCRKFMVTCEYEYDSHVWTGAIAKGDHPNRPTAMGINGLVLHHDAEEDWLASQTDSGRWEATGSTSVMVIGLVEIDSSWQRLVKLQSRITAGTRAGGDSGPWMGAGFTSTMKATCSFSDAGPCD